MEKKYPIGTEVETRFSGMVVGYNPPNYYRILKLNHFREEEFHENNITVPPGIASLHSVPPSLPETIEDCKPPPIKLEEEPIATVDHYNSMPCRTDRTRPIKQTTIFTCKERPNNYRRVFVPFHYLYPKKMSKANHLVSRKIIFHPQNTTGSRTGTIWTIL